MAKKDSYVYVEITPQELKRFNSVIDDMVKISKASYEKVVRNTARDVTREALRNTALAPKKRKISRPSNKKYWIKTKHKYTGERVVFPGTLEQAEKYSEDIYAMKNKGNYLGNGYYKVPNRGFMKAAWVAVGNKLGLNMDPGIGSVEKYGIVQTKGSASNFMIKLINAIPFVFEFDKGKNRWKTRQNIVERSIQKILPVYEKMMKNAFTTGKLAKGGFRKVYNSIYKVEK